MHKRRRTGRGSAFSWLSTIQNSSRIMMNIRMEHQRLTADNSLNKIIIFNLCYNKKSIIWLSLITPTRIRPIIMSKLLCPLSYHHYKQLSNNANKLITYISKSVTNINYIKAVRIYP